MTNGLNGYWGELSLSMVRMCLRMSSGSGHRVLLASGAHLMLYVATISGSFGAAVESAVVIGSFVRYDASSSS